jgi:trans-aconitate methyltransferase
MSIEALSNSANFLDDYEFFKKGSIFLDAGCGGGANTHFLSLRYPECTFHGSDINAELLKFAALQNSKIRYLEMDIHDADRCNGAYDGILSFQTLSWLPEFEKPWSALLQSGAKILLLVVCSMKVQFPMLSRL